MDFNLLKETVVNGEYKKIQERVQAGLDEGIDPQSMLDEALVPAMEEVGRRFSKCEIFIPEMMVAAKVMQMALDIINPILAASGGKVKCKIAVGTVKDDLHDIGKNIVCAMMQGAGFEVEDLGVDCPPERFIEAIKAGTRIIGISAILTTVLVNISKTIETITQAGLRDKVKILVGGAAVNETIATKMGADAYCEDAGAGVLIARDFIADA